MLSRSTPSAFDIDRDLAGGLDRIGMKDGPPLAGDTRQFGDRLNRSDLVVGVHDRHERGVVGERSAEFIR